MSRYCKVVMHSEVYLFSIDKQYLFLMFMYKTVLRKMEAFLEQLRILQTQFDALSSEDHKDALAAVAEAVSSMRDASVRRRFEKEVELTLAWEAEKMIVERFTGDCSLMGVYSVPSTSTFDLEPNSSFYEDIDSNEGEFIWPQPGGGEQSLDKRLRTELDVGILNPQPSELPKGGYPYPIGQVDVAAADERHEDTQASPASNEMSRESVNPPATIPPTGMDSGKENRFVCATCGFLGNNRKALYRHGVKTRHVLRVSNSAGLLACEYCPFRTNKTFNFNRHMKRFHSDK
ncbi:hypothetical protein Y032_0002g631 [Ancylostoma ceylanicum]|uniref:C2H2-type domain-containing protein n=1 Tax=Ancylostoma ceylanicum TaxID=53326 RepID=A0A016W2F2_9BILA|nr:hypothetical protein Y032_0002g631 [Ancylostoma ceylanicum]